MSTSGAYTPPAAPECPYAPRMTRAAALALAAGGGLLENCVVVIVDGPTIGIAGNTSPTEIELNPVSPTELGLTARVHTTFDDVAWDGLYDIGLGTAGSIIKLTDSHNNVVEDTDADSPTVHTQWPWHLGSTTLRDNYVSDTTFTGLPGAGALAINDCKFSGATVNLTGSTGANTWANSQFTNASLTLSGGNNTFTRSRFGNVVLTHSGAGALTVNDSHVTNFFRIVHTGTTNLTVTRCEMSNQGNSGTGDLVHSATVGNTTILDSEVIGGTTSGAIPTLHNDGNAGAGNTLSVTRSKVLLNYAIRKQAGSTATVGIQGTIFRGLGVADMTATATGQLTILGADIQSSSVIVNGSGIVIGQHPVTSVVGGSALYGATVQTLAGSTKTIQYYSVVHLGGTVQVGVIAGAGTLLFDNSRINGAPGVVVVDILGAPTGVTTVLKSSEVASGGRLVTSSNGDASQFVLENTQVETGALLTMSAGASSVKNSRFSGSAIVTSGAFAHNQVIVDGAFTKTATAANVNRLVNKSFDDWV